MRPTGRIAGCAFAILLTGCASFGAVVGEFEKGVTTQADVLDRLGPPSQLINLKDQIVYYYLAEKTSGNGKIFIVWNKVSAETQYDRAIFFFDTNGVLEDFAYSKEEIPR